MSGEPLLRVSVLGAGGHAKVVIATLRAAGHRAESVFDDDPRTWGQDVLGVPVRGGLEQAAHSTSHAVIALGSNALRKAVAQRLELKWLTLVHPAAWVAPSAKLGAGTVVFAGAVVQPQATLGAHVIVNTGATVDHDCQVGDYVHVTPGANVCGAVRVGEGALLGVGSAVIPSVSIGCWTTVGAGSVVVRDLPDHATAWGVPARTREGETDP